jgi:hypothetical protein
MRSCIDDISRPAIGSTRRRCKCRGSSQARLGTAATDTLTAAPLSASTTLPHYYVLPLPHLSPTPARALSLHLPCGRCMHAFLLVGAGTAVAGHIRRSLPAR